MAETPRGTPVGVDDPYEEAGPCDHLTDDGRCRFALTRAGDDPAFAREREQAAYACVAADGEFRDCPHYRCTTDGRECRRCGLDERRVAHDDARPLIEEHHLSYGEASSETAHEITVGLCRWCHAKVHAGRGRITDDATPDPDALAERDARRSAERAEAGFQTAAERSEFDASTDE